MEAHQDLVDSLYSHADQQLGFKKPPTLIFQSDPRNYGALSKTAQYDPRTQEITIYVDGRHIKDILRSFAHELVHHHQNEQGRLSGANVTQGEQDFDDIEGEAYHTGNLKLFRKREDGIKQKNPTIYNERRIYKMSTKKWKNKELSNLMTEKFGYKMDLSKLNESVQEEQLEEAVEELEEAAEQLNEKGCAQHEEMVEGRCVPKEEIEEGRGEKCRACGKMTTKGDGEKCPSCDKKLAGEAMNEEEEEEDGGKEHPLDVAPPHTGKPDAKDFAKLRQDKKLKEHRVQNHGGFYMDLNKLLK